jgi:tyrosyl-tRNA synthetase
MPLMRGTDGEQKMSKSYDNYIGISEPASEQFGKAMSAPDSLLDEWTRLAGIVDEAELAQARALAASDPYAAKRALARRIAATYHGADEADRAEAAFDRLFRDHATPEDIPEISVPMADERLKADGDTVQLAGLLVAAGLAASNSEAGRLLEQGAIHVDEARIDDRNARVRARLGSGVLLQRGKRHFVRAVFGA